VNKILLLAAALMLPIVGNSAMADEHEGGFWSYFSLERKKGVRPVDNESWLEECGACHFAYQPGLLPTRSWRKLFEAKALADHFGENAELGDETRLALLDFAVLLAADRSGYKRAKKINRSIPEDVAPLRIIETRYIKRKHDEIPDKLIKGNEEVKSLSFCDNCHRKATEGVYDDDTVDIKGHGPWDD
jgi:cytochrome c553